jgi:two-component sensor histidine kinase
MTTLRSYLVAMATLLVLLLCAGMALVLGEVDAYRRTRDEQQLLDTTRAMSLALDGRMRSYEALLLGLRESEALRREDWPAFDAQARRAIAGSGAWIVVDDPTGRQRVNTRLTPGQPLAHSAPPQEEWRTIRQGRTHYCNLTDGYVVPQILCVDVPVIHDGQVVYALSVIFQPQLLDRSFAPYPRGGRFITVLDRNGRIVWRNRGLQNFLGRTTTPQMQQVLAQRPEDVRSAMSLDGVPTLIAFSRSDVSGWTSVVGVPLTQVGVLSELTLGYGLLGGALCLVVGGGVGLLAGRQVSWAVQRLGAATERIRQGLPPAFERSGFSEVDAAGEALEAAVRERDADQERLRFLMREVDHRANNLMAVVQSAVRLSRGRDADDLRKITLGRVEALARAHQLLAESRWRGADLRRLVEEELRPYTLGDAARVRITGGAAPLSPAAAQGVAMALHELATNAVKHGSLSVPEGQVEVRWTVEGDHLRIRWSESDGPPVEKPERNGFGATVLRRALDGSVRGRTELDWRPEGLVCEMQLPMTTAAAE